MGAADAADVKGLVTPSPRFRWVPPQARSLGPDAVAFATSLGVVLDGHQEQILEAFMGQDDRGGWVSLENALVEARQNGKTEAFLIRVLFGAFELGERHCVFSAHMWATAHEAWLRACDMIEGCADMSGRVSKVRRSAADLGFILTSGARIRFLTRSRATARGFSGDVMVFDESHFLPEATHSSLLPALSARSMRGKVQVLYGCSAADQTRHPDALVMARLRARGIKGDDPTLAYLEWSAHVVDEDGNEVAPDLVPDEVAADPAVWRQANPALGIRIAEEHVAAELRALDRRSFSTERLCIGDWPDPDAESSGPLHIDDWLELIDEASEIEGPICVGFDVGPDRRTSVAIAGRRADGLFHVEITDYQQGASFLVERVKQLVAAHDPWLVVADPYGLGGVIIARLEEEGVTVQTVTAAEHSQACGLLVDMVAERTLRHLGSGELIEAIKGSSTRGLADGWVWSRKNSSVSISPLVSATLAVWAAAGMPVEEWTPQVF